MGGSDKLPFSLFTTEHLNPRHQFDAWHHSISVIFDTAPLAERPPVEGFKASVRAYHLGDLVVSQVDFDSQRFVREKHRTRTDGLDHYLVQLYAVGGLVGTADGRERILRAGDVQILDLSRQNATEAKASGTIALVVPRETLREALPGAGELHGLVLRGDSGTGGLLADYMKSLFVRASGLTAAEAPLIARSTTSMIAACFHTTAETLARARTPFEAAMLARIQRHIAATLDSPGLGPDALCSTFRISRTTLYRLFERLGGVAAYIQEQRLARARAQLCDPAQDHRRIFEIAFRWGFASEAHFSRLFRQTFGLSPSDMRARARASLPAAVSGAESTPGGAYRDWLRGLRRSV